MKAPLQRGRSGFQAGSAAPLGGGAASFCLPTQNGRATAANRAGVSSFGVGGTNCHIVLEASSSPPVDGTAAAEPALLEKRAPQHHVLPLAAKTEAALLRLKECGENKQLLSRCALWCSVRCGTGPTPKVGVTKPS